MPSVTKKGECVTRPFSIRLKLARGQSQARAGRGRAALLRLAVTGLTVLGLSQLLPVPAAFGQVYSYSGSVNATISIFQPVRTITLSTNATTFNNCQTNGGGL